MASLSLPFVQRSWSTSLRATGQRLPNPLWYGRCPQVVTRWIVAARNRQLNPLCPESSSLPQHHFTISIAAHVRSTLSARNASTLSLCTTYMSSEPSSSRNVFLPKKQEASNTPRAGCVAPWSSKSQTSHDTCRSPKSNSVVTTMVAPHHAHNTANPGGVEPSKSYRCSRQPRPQQQPHPQSKR